MLPFISYSRKDISISLELSIKVQLFWVPGHANIDGNVIADKAAKEACGFADQIYDFCPNIDFLPKLKKEVINNMQNYFISYGGYRKARLYVSHSNKFCFSPWFGPRGDLSRRQVCLVNRMHSGHSRARAHLASKGFLVEEECECDGRSHSFDNLVWDCPAYSDQRHVFILECRRARVTPGSSLYSISFNHGFLLKALTNFIVQCNMPV